MCSRISILRMAAVSESSVCFCSLRNASWSSRCLRMRMRSIRSSCVSPSVRAFCWYCSICSSMCLSSVARSSSVMGCIMLIFRVICFTSSSSFSFRYFASSSAFMSSSLLANARARPCSRKLSRVSALSSFAWAAAVRTTATSTFFSCASSAFMPLLIQRSKSCCCSTVSAFASTSSPSRLRSARFRSSASLSAAVTSPLNRSVSKRPPNCFFCATLLRFRSAFSRRCKTSTSLFEGSRISACDAHSTASSSFNCPWYACAKRYSALMWRGSTLSTSPQNSTASSCRASLSAHAARFKLHVNCTCVKRFCKSAKSGR
mmetsp:Transcript_27386/g.89643  ORF Transcript_27386/g.89643 Transcript_27386/m.89643 type:complete len:317 (+) Transcript_27386:59-1009(+)